LIFATVAKTIFLALLAATVTTHQTTLENDTTRLSDLSHAKMANFKQEHASQETRYVADWVVNSGDNNSMPFVIVDKKNAKVFVFYADGQLRGATPALLGLAKGDDPPPASAVERYR